MEAVVSNRENEEDRCYPARLSRILAIFLMFWQVAVIPEFDSC